MHILIKCFSFLFFCNRDTYTIIHLYQIQELYCNEEDKNDKSNKKINFYTKYTPIIQHQQQNARLLLQERGRTEKEIEEKPTYNTKRK
jgi:hypothetical protein